MTDCPFNECIALLRNDFATFVEFSFAVLNPGTEFIPGKYIDLVAATLDLCSTKDLRRLILNLPPRSLKSHCASVALPAWILGQDPTKQIISASYGQDLANKFALDCRNLMESPFYRQVFPATRISREKQSMNDFMTTARGGRMATSVGGPLTGRGADIFICDDIQKPADALSDVRREDANQWFFHSARSRLNSREHGVIIIVMQRLHQNDLAGELLEREEGWSVLSLPAIATRDEAYRYRTPFGWNTFQRKIGDVLHPERDSLEVLTRERAAVGEYNFQSQYQQDPTPREGALVKREWLKFYETESLPRLNQFDHILQSWDTASKSGELNDYSVCTTWGVYNRQFYLLDVFRRKCEYPVLKREVKSLFEKYDPSKVLIEDRSTGTSLLQELKWEGVYCLEPYKSEAGRDKHMRLADQSIKFEQGRVWLPNDASWLDAYIKELTGFPGSKHDDQVDATTQALDVLGALTPGFEEFTGFRPIRCYETW